MHANIPNDPNLFNLYLESAIILYILDIFIFILVITFQERVTAKFIH